MINTSDCSGLFHRAIAESGSMLADWALDRNARRTGLRIAELAGCLFPDEKDTVECLRSLDAIALHNAQKQFSVGIAQFVLTLSPHEFHVCRTKMRWPEVWDLEDSHL